MLKFLLLVALAAAACASESASTKELLLGCDTKFNTRFEAAAGNEADECSAYAALNDCIRTSLASVDMKSPMSALQLANNIIHKAVARPTLCVLSTVGFSAKEPIVHHSARGTVITLYELADRVSALEEFRAGVLSTASNTMTSVYDLLNQYNSVLTSVVGSLFANNVAGLNARLTAATNTLNLARNAINSVNAAATDAQNYATSALTAEANARASAKGSIDAAAASLSTTIANGLAAASTDRANMRSTAVATNPATSIISQITSQATFETARDASSATARAAAELAQQTTKSASVSTALVSELSRATAACTTKISNFQYSLPKQNGANDDQACVSPGAAYYSTKNSMVYVCNGQFYLPVLMQLSYSGLPTSKLLTPNQRGQLMSYLGTHQKWLKCFTATIDGFSTSTFRSNCNGKGTGPQLIVIKESGSGRLFGGYTDLPYTPNSFGWRYAQGAWTYRFTTDGNQLDVMLPYQYNNPYAVYDSTSYGPIWGYGAGSWDICVYSGLTSGYVGMYGYWTYYSYKVNFSPCTGCGYGGLYTNSYPNFSMSDMEVFYRNT